MKKNENEIVSKAKKIVSDSYKKYFEVINKYAKGDISKQEFKQAKKQLLKGRDECYELKSQTDPIDYDPALDFAYPMTKEELHQAIEPGLEKLNGLRKDGETKVNQIWEQILNIKLRKNIKRKEKKDLCAPLLVEYKEAKKIAKERKHDIDALVKENTIIAVEFAKVYDYYVRVVANNDKQVANNNAHAARLLEYETYRLHLKGLNKKEKKFAKVEHKSKINEIERDQKEVVCKAKDSVHDGYLTLYSIKREIKNNNLSFGDKCGLRWENYKHKFTWSNFFLKNSLYIVILIFFIACCIIASTQGNPLLTGRTIETIFIQSSTKVFFSLGVAGLILLGGTDLSIGRMTGMAATFSCMFLSLLKYETNIGIISTIGWGQAVAIVVGIFVCIFSTTLFSAIAGFFTAKFKMHPFITTLSTQLLIYGIMMVCFSQVPAFTMDPGIKTGITGGNGYRLIIYAVIAIILIWFIWNKTKFGKNMYAVGDNKEAAAVSGINVFCVTMGVFIMAGILYGVGGFLEGARIGNANPSTALGTELDAIAACVIGGISFSGGKGKVSGAVIGTIIFTTLTYCLTYIGLDINFQYIFKGIIIMAAVCLDSLKFLKKK